MSVTLPVESSELEQIASRMLEEASSAGATSAETSISVTGGFSVNVRLGEVETVEYQRDRGLTLTAYIGQCRGSASTADFSHEALRETAEKAVSIAKFTSPDEASGLADAKRMATDLPDLSLSHPWGIDTDQAIEMAVQCEQAARGFDSRIRNSEGAAVNTYLSSRMYGNSHGFVGGFQTSSHGLSCSVLASEDTQQMERDYWYSSMRDAKDLEAAVSVGEEAARRAVARLGARKLTTRNAKVLYPPHIARSLFGHFLGAISGGSQYRRSSFLLDGIGKKVFPEFISIEENPHIPKAFGSVPMDAEGVATYRRDVVSNGVVQDYIMGSYSARRLGRESTANAGGIQNMIVSSGEQDLDALRKEMGTGLLVSELIGQGVNPTTGDYSRGAAGFWIEDGEIAYPVHEITIAGNLLDMYQRLIAVGSDIDRRSKVHCGSVLLDELKIAGD